MQTRIAGLLYRSRKQRELQNCKLIVCPDAHSHNYASRLVHEKLGKVTTFNYFPKKAICNYQVEEYRFLERILDVHEYVEITCEVPAGMLSKLVQLRTSYNICPGVTLV